MGINIEPMLAGLRMRLAEHRRQVVLDERQYLRSLKWTDEQLAAFDERVTGINWRADRVLGDGQ